MYFYQRIRGRGIAAFAGVLLSITAVMPGCGGPDTPAEGTLPPGSMELVSVTPVSADTPSGNLLYNGDFSEFWAGAPAPTGFNVPAEGGASKVARGVGLKDRGVSNFSAVQTWDRPDLGMGPEHRLGTQVKGLKPATAYRLEVLAEGGAGVLTGIGVAQLDAKGKATDLVPCSLYVAGGIGPKTYTGHFVTQAGGDHVLTSLLVFADKLPAAVTWYEWRLSEAPGEPERLAAEARMRDSDGRRKRIEWQLRQFNEMIAGLKGYDAWREKVAPFITNLTETLKLVADTGSDVFEGEDAYLFSRFGSLFLLEQELAYTKESEYTSAVRAIVDFNRQLAGRGIDLIFVPAPVRGAVYPDKLVPGIDPALHVAPQMVRLMQLLNNLDVEAVDMLDVLRASRQRNESVFLRSEARFTSAAIARTARALTGRLDRYSFLESGETPRVEYQTANKPVTWRGSMLKDLPEERQAAYADEAQALTQVLDAQGNLFQAPAKAPIAVMGNVGMQYAEEGGSLAAHLSKELRLPIALLPVQDPGPGAPRKLAELGPDALDGVRVLIWVVPMNYFRESDSYTWESMPEY